MLRAILLTIATLTSVQAAQLTNSYTLKSTDSTISVLRFLSDTPTLFSDVTDIRISYNAVLGGVGGVSPRMMPASSNSQSLIIGFGVPGSFPDPTFGTGNTGNVIGMNDVVRRKTALQAFANRL